MPAMNFRVGGGGSQFFPSSRHEERTVPRVLERREAKKSGKIIPSMALRSAAAGLTLSLALLAGCGTPAAPQPPSLKLPQPVTDLAVQRSGNDVRLQWTMPKRTTDRVILVGDQKAHICRRLDSQPCENAADLLLAPDKPAEFVDHLPSALTSGPPRLLTYVVELRNRSNHTAGPSNSVSTAAGAAPAQIADFSATAAADGVVLHWKPVSADTGTLIRLHRELVVKPGGPKSPSQAAGSPAPAEQTLEITGPDKGIALDRDAALDHTYRYTAERVMKLTLARPPFELLSASSETITIDARDVFPPATPTGLQAVADPDARAIDLSWNPNTDADIAGYAVYRRDAGSAAAPVRVSPPGQVPAPSFRDSAVTPGRAYVYSISALDRDGNESPRSAEVEETLPANP